MKALLVWFAAVGTAQEPTPLEVEVVARLDGVGDRVAVAPDGSSVATVDGDTNTATICSVATGEVRRAPFAGSVRSIALLANGGCWLGLAQGSLVHVVPDREPRRFDGVSPEAIDCVDVRGATVAWSSTKAGRGGVVDARDGAARFAVDGPWTGSPPHLHPSLDGRLVAHPSASAGRGGRTTMIVRDASTGDQVATAAGYLKLASSAIVFVPGSAYTAARVADEWQLHRLDLVSFENEVIDDELRGGHYVDLYPSPSGRFLLEGDTGDAGAMLYRLEPGGAHRRLLAPGGCAVGFVMLRGAELALTTDPDADNSRGLVAWSADGERRATFAFAADERVMRAGPLGRNAMWVQTWTSDASRRITRQLWIVRATAERR